MFSRIQYFTCYMLMKMSQDKVCHMLHVKKFFKLLKLNFKNRKKKRMNSWDIKKLADLIEELRQKKK